MVELQLKTIILPSLSSFISGLTDKLACSAHPGYHLQLLAPSCPYR